MCLAIYKPVDVDIPTKHLENGFSNHSDGAGMAWAENGKLYVRKGMFRIEDVLEQYEKVKHLPCLIHFRKATHGTVDATNCHPFLFNDGKLALIHNGVLSIKCCIAGLSDTAHFVKLVLEPLIKGRGIPINDGALNYLICTSIGSDKLAIMDETGKTFIFNEDKGNWEGGAWYSNTSFRFAYSTYKVPVSQSVSGPVATALNHPYLNNHPGGNNACCQSGRNIQKHWKNADGEVDEAYLEFWRKTGSHIAAIGPGNTQRIPLLLENGKDGVDDAGNVTTIEEAQDETPKPGTMCDYGWFDPEIEEAIAAYQQNTGINREDAMIRVFNEM